MCRSRGQQRQADPLRPAGTTRLRHSQAATREARGRAPETPHPEVSRELSPGKPPYRERRRHIWAGAAPGPRGGDSVGAQCPLPGQRGDRDAHWAPRDSTGLVAAAGKTLASGWRKIRYEIAAIRKVYSQAAGARAAPDRIESWLSRSVMEMRI